SRPTAAASNLAVVCSPSRSTAVVVRSRSTSRSTTTAYSPSLPPKCSYTTGLETPAWAAISSIEVPSNPRSAHSRRPTSSSCSRRSFPVMRLLPGLEERDSVTASSCRLRRLLVSLARGLYRLFTGRPIAGPGPGALRHGGLRPGAEDPLGAGRALDRQPLL